MSPNFEYLEFLFTSFSYYIKTIIFGLCEEGTFFEIFTHVNSGFTFTILHIIRTGKNMQLLFYINIHKIYSDDCNLIDRKNMIIHEFIRLLDYYQMFKKLIDFFNEKLHKDELMKKIFFS